MGNYTKLILRTRSFHIFLIRRFIINCKNCKWIVVPSQLKKVNLAFHQGYHAFPLILGTCIDRNKAPLNIFSDKNYNFKDYISKLKKLSNSVCTSNLGNDIEILVCAPH